MRKLLLILLCCTLLTGCVPVDAGTVPPTEPTGETEALTAVAPRKENYDPYLVIFPYQINGYGFDGELHLDGDGIYYSYEGGEMCITAFHQARGLSQKGIALFLYVDGRPQPFHTEERPRDAYMHMIYPENGVDTFTDIYFTPVVGEEGDTLEISLLSMTNPDCYLDFMENNVRNSFSLDVCSTTVRMKYNATPPDCDLPSVTDRLISVTSYTEPRASQQVYEKEVDWSLYLDHYFATGGIQTLKGDTETQTLTFRLWGDPVAEFGLIFYIDHQPVSVAPEDILLVQPSEGENLVVQVELDLSDFRAQSLIYAVLVPRNVQRELLEASCDLRVSGMFCLLGDDDPRIIAEVPTTP